MAPTDPETRVETAAAVLGTLDRRPRMHVAELGDLLGVDPAAVDEVCFQLQRDGHVRARGCGDYAITGRGEQRLRRLRREDYGSTARPVEPTS